MIKGDYDMLTHLADINICPDHPDKPLNVAWHSEEKCYIIRCGGGHYPDAITKRTSLTDEYKRGAELPEPIKSNMEKGSRQRAQASKSPAPMVLGEVLGTDLGTGEVLSPPVVTALMQYARKYALDPYRGHVCLYYGKPYITIDGYLFHADRSETPYSLSSRPLEEEERKTYQIPEGSHAWWSKVEKHKDGGTFYGLGIVTQEDMTEESKRTPGQLRYPVVAKHPWQLAQKRADWQALRRAFPIGNIEAIGTGGRADLEEK